jgi:hypothetical protein
MIFRALFWIGVVSLLAPHEPDLGLGHPGAGTLRPSSAGLSRTERECGSQCAGGLGLMKFIHLDTGTSVTAGLADVKAQIEADQRARRLRAQASYSSL